MKLRPGIDQLEIFIAVAPTMISTNTVNCRNHLVGKSPLGGCPKKNRKFFVNADLEIAVKIFTVRHDLCEGSGTDYKNAKMIRSFGPQFLF